MPPKTDELIVPPYPRSERARLTGIGDVRSIELDIKKVENAPNPGRALAWNAYDPDIQNIVSDYNNYLRTTRGYVSLDWHLIKAMVWTETGPHAPRDDWTRMPMQSANQHDPGWGDMMRHGDRMALIVPPDLRSAVASPNFDGKDNIAGNCSRR